MAAEGKNKVASSLLDLQPTAILELFRVYPDRINRPTIWLGFHGGTVYDKSIKWQGSDYLPLAVETEGFDILGDGKLARPKIRVSNHNNIITNLLQNHKDFKNAKVIRKRVSVKFIDDDNFEGGNPFGEADSKAELTNETWLMGRKTQESKVFVEFELNSPLDLENFTVNNRNIVSKFCYWQYRGEGCRYAGIPIERDDGQAFLDADGNAVVPLYRPPENATSSDPDSPVSFFDDPSAYWNPNREYIKGDIAVQLSPTIKLSTRNPNEEGTPLKTVYVCVSGNVGQTPDSNPTYWQKDGCTKKLAACRKRFNEIDLVSFVEGQNIQTGFSGVRISGMPSQDNPAIPDHTGLFHSTESGITGHFTGAWTIMGWANINKNSPIGAGIFSTSAKDDGDWPDTRFLNINSVTSSNGIRNTNTIAARYVGYVLKSNTSSSNENAYRKVDLHAKQDGGDSREWVQYVITNSTDTANFINGEGNDQDTLIKFYVNGVSKSAVNESQRGQSRLSSNLGNFASLSERRAITWDDGKKALPQTFMLGAVEYYAGLRGYENSSAAYTTSMNGCIGPWATWNRALNDEEISFLYKTIRTPNGFTNSFDFVPRSYYECTKRMSTLTGGTGDGLPDGTAPLLYGKDSLVAWWDASTGIVAGSTLGLLDIHTGSLHLTGSGEFEAIQETYKEAPQTLLPNPTPVHPRFGGFPGTDGFSYGRDTQV